MPRVSDLIRASCLKDVPRKMPDMETLRRTEWSKEFEELCKNRMIMGSFRYERMEEKKKKTSRYDYIGDAVKRLNKYQATGNAEYLVDVANLCMLEFLFGEHKQKHFSSSDDGEHCQKI
jgi:hypothetical protein